MAKKLKVFQFPMPKPRSAQVEAVTLPSDVYVSEGEQPMVIQGQHVDSKEEWYFAQALEKLKVKYIYQYAVMGGNVRGGQVVDFLCLVAPSSKAVQIYGEYWHREEVVGDDKIMIYILESIFGKENVIIILASDLKDIPTATNAARRELRL